MAKSEDELSSINWAEAGKEAGDELGVVITIDNELSSINSAEVGKETGHESSVELTADDNEWIISILEEGSIAYSPDKLQKVPQELREKEENKGFFDPRVVSIGPYHHGKPELKEAERFKSRAASIIIAGSKVEPREIYKKMLELVSDARSCYIEGSTDAYDDVAFARMMLIDGCFILQFLYCILSEYGFFDELLNHGGNAALRSMIVDISLLENQLPFLVLEALISSTSTYPEGKWEEWIENSIVNLYIDVNATWRDQTYKDEEEQPLHLLDLIRRRFIGQPRPSCSFKPIIPCWPKRRHRLSDPQKDVYSHSFRSATELKARGIHFRPSNTFFLQDFTFTSRFGYGLLTLPHLRFSRRIKYLLLNMMVYELTRYTEGSEVFYYIYFMNSLINGAEDVIELRTRNIIHNFYGTDEEVAKAFNSMATGGGTPSLEGPIKDVSDRIQEHYNSRIKTWTAQLWHNYFGNPWSALAFLAATFALILTFIQTFFPC